MKIQATESAIVRFTTGRIKAYPIIWVNGLWTNPAAIVGLCRNPYINRARGLPGFLDEDNGEGDVVEIVTSRRERGAVTRWEKQLKADARMAARSGK